MCSYFEHWRLAVKGNLRPERGSGAGFLLLLPYRGATSKGGVRPGTCPRPRHGRGSGRGDGLAEGLGSEDQRAPVAGLRPPARTGRDFGIGASTPIASSSRSEETGATGFLRGDRAAQRGPFEGGRGARPDRTDKSQSPGVR
jgi:hypothetical protein